MPELGSRIDASSVIFYFDVSMKLFLMKLSFTLHIECGRIREFLWMSASCEIWILLFNYLMMP